MGVAPDLRAATAVSCTLVAGALLADVALIRRGLRDPERPVGLISDVGRTPAGVTFLTVFGLHLAGMLGHLDPFRLIGLAARADLWGMVADRVGIRPRIP